MIRPLQPDDLSAVTVVLDYAFVPSHFETRLVAALAERTDSLIWVTFVESQLVGVIAYSPAYRGEAVIGYHLAPVAVRPDHQRRGIGSGLITATLAMSKQLKNAAIFVLGDPVFYERFGFKSVADARCPYDPDNKHFRALNWADDGEVFTIAYCPAFDLEG